jgi:uncharacterized membrane protein (GlpM family)
MNFIVKILLSSLIIALASELSKRNSFISALLISLPLISILSFAWIYFDTKDVNKIITLSYEVLWLIIPSLAFFIILPLLLKNGLNFYVSLLVSILMTSVVYGVFIYMKKLFNF